MRTAKFRTTLAPGPCAFVSENVNGLPGLRWYCEAVRTSATASRASSAWNIRPATIFGRSITVPYARLNPPIGWNVTGVSNIDNIEVRYSTDDGMTFPISNLILFTNNPEITIWEWTVPNTPTVHAVIRVLVGKKSGDAVQTLSGVFTISGDGTATPPKISGASVSGKKLFVFGESFQMGAVVLLNGDEQGTLNDDDFSHMLRCKKAGKKIAPGATVTLRVLNPDGTLSDPFSFTRPLE